MLNPRLTEGSEEWADNITENARQHLLAYHDVLAAHLFIKKLVDDWDILEAVLRAALFQSALTVYARPLVDNRSTTGPNRRFSIPSRVSRTIPDFNGGLHKHILRLRHTLIAHHDTSVVKAQLSHMTLTNQQEEGKSPSTLQTEGKVKALHAIAKKEIAEQYLKHMAAFVDYLYRATHDSLGKLHRVRVLHPNLGIAKLQSLSVEFERLGDDRFRLPFANPKPIDEPTFMFPPSSYIWLEYTQTYYEVGPLPANGEPKVEVLDLEKPRLPNPTALNPYGKRSGG